MTFKRSFSIGGISLCSIFLVSAITLYLSMGDCPKGSFSCDNGTICVPQKRICNSHPDCKDGSDEDRSECGMFHGNTRLSSGIMLNVATSRNNSIPNVTNISCAIKSYPSACKCSNTKVYCGSRNSNSFQMQNINISAEVTHLLIVGTTLKLESNFLQNLNLTYLYLKNNNLQNIPMGFFATQNNLQKLFICYNLIEKLPKGILYGLRKTHWMFLNSNLLKELPLEILLDTPELVWLNLTENQLTLENDEFPKLKNLSEILIDFNLIEKVSNNTFSELTSLEHLSLAYNDIKFIEGGAFSNLRSLKALRLNGNQLLEINNNVFQNNKQLEVLYLSYTSISITSMLLKNLNLSYLNLQGISSENIDFRAIENLPNLQYVLYKKFNFCSMTPLIKKCKPNSDGISSNEDLLTKPVLRYSTWMMAVLTLIGNLLVLWGRFIFRDENRTVTMVVRNLACSDMLMGLYLTIIGIQDFRFRDHYFQVAHKWMSSWGCVGIGALAVISSEVSMLILAFMSLERFLLIADPFKRHCRLNSRNVSVCLISIWIFGLCIAISPIIIWNSMHVHSGICFPLHVQEKYSIGWEYSAFTFLGLNLFLLLMMAMLYSALLLSIWRTRRATPLAVMDFEFAIRFFLIVLTSVSCWAPIIIMKIWTFLNYDISDDIHAWLVVFILPLNSAVNPLLYTFTTPKYKNQILLRNLNTSRRTEDSPTESKGTFILFLQRSQKK